MAAVFSNHVSRGAAAVVDLKKVKVAAGTVLNIEERKGDTKNLEKEANRNKINGYVI